MSKSKFNYHLWLFWGFVIVISYKFLAPASHSGIAIPHLDKIAHCGIFFVLSWFANRAYSLTRLQYFGVLGVYGALIEWLQSMTGYRSAELLDWVADMLGVVLFFIALELWQKFNTRRLKSRA